MTGQKEQVLPPWGLALAGSTGALVANALVYPLDMFVPPHNPQQCAIDHSP